MFKKRFPSLSSLGVSVHLSDPRVIIFRPIKSRCHQLAQSIVTRYNKVKNQLDYNLKSIAIAIQVSHYRATYTVDTWSGLLGRPHKWPSRVKYNSQLGIFLAPFECTRPHRCCSSVSMPSGHTPLSCSPPLVIVFAFWRPYPCVMGLVSIDSWNHRSSSYSTRSTSICTLYPPHHARWPTTDPEEWILFRRWI